MGTEHILLGLILEQEGVAAKVLMNRGLTVKSVREELRMILGHGVEPNRISESRQSVDFRPVYEIQPLVSGTLRSGIILAAVAIVSAAFGALMHAWLSG